MGKYDNYSNQKNIARLQKKLDRLLAKKKPDLYAVDMMEKELQTAKLFETCQIFGREDSLKNIYDPNANIMFSDDNEVLMFCDKLIHYSELKSYAFVENKIAKATTTTKTSGAIPRAVVGGALFGEVGAVVGALSAGSNSNTTYRQVANGFYLQIFLKNGRGYQTDVPNAGFFSNKMSEKWLELGRKLQTIIENNE